MGCIFNFLPWLQEHWAHSGKFCFRLREGWFSVQLRWNGWFYIALTVRTQRKRERLWFTVALLPCQSIRPPSATLYSKTLKLKHTLPATGRLEVCVCVWWIQAWLIPAAASYGYFLSSFSWARPEGCVKTHHALCLYKINDWCCNQWPLEAQC